MQNYKPYSWADFAPVPSLLVVELPGNVGEVDGRVVLPLQERVEAVLRAQGALLLLVEYGVHFHCTFGSDHRIFSHLLGFVIVLSREVTLSEAAILNCTSG